MFQCLQRVPPSVFWNFATGCWKSPKGPFYIFWYFETVQNSHFSFFFPKIYKFFFLKLLMSPKGSPFIFLKFCNWMDVEKAQRAPCAFFGTMRLFKILNFRFFSRKFINFFYKIFECLQRVPPSFFLKILQLDGCWKSPKGPFYIFWHYETVQNSHFSFFFQKFWNFFLKFFNVSKSFNFSSFIFFDILHHTGFSKSPKGPPFTNLKTFRLLSLGYSADYSRRSRLANMASFQRRQVMNHAVCSGILII